MLNTENVSGVHGESRWAAVSVVRILQNEKYKGDLLMQKYYIRDFLTKELEKNDGKLTQYYVENDHEAIIEREIWDAAQLEINRIKEFKRNHQIRELGSSSLEPFYGKIFCGCCGGRMVKKSRKSVWRCINSGKERICKCCLGTAGIPERKSSARLGERYCPGKCPGALTCSTDEKADRKVSCLVPGGEEDENGDWGNYNWG